jgi:hypothetical protein
MARGIITLQSEEVVAGRPFTDAQHTQTDLAIMRYLAAHLGLTLDSWIGDELNGRPLERYFPTTEAWWHRVIVTQPGQLITTQPLVVVGFFGQRCLSPNERLVELTCALDSSLMDELPNYEDLLAYSSLALPTGNYSNLVVFTREEGIKQWGRSERHAEAVRILAPELYLSVRLYNGVLPRGLQRTDELRLTVVKYYDYQETPQWRAVRAFQ